LPKLETDHLFNGLLMLQRVVDNLQEHHQLDMGNVYLQLEEFDLKELAEECVDLFRLQAEMKNIHIILNIIEPHNLNNKIYNDK
jgi:signal transduction histidine kinase